MASGQYPDTGGSGGGVTSGALTGAVTKPDGSGVTTLAAAIVADANLGSGVPHGWTRVAVTGTDKQDIDIAWNGETGQCLEVMGFVTSISAASTITVQPNAVSTNATSTDIEGTGVAAGTVSDTKLILGYTANAANAMCQFDFRFLGKTGTPRTYSGNYTMISAAGAVGLRGTVGGCWNDTGTAITSIRLHSDKADGFKIGSYILYRTVPVAA